MYSSTTSGSASKSTSRLVLGQGLVVVFWLCGHHRVNGMDVRRRIEASSAVTRPQGCLVQTIVAGVVVVASHSPTGRIMLNKRG